MSFTHLTPEMVLEIYRHGAFPMAGSGHSDEFEIYEARERSILPFENIHVPRSLRKRILKNEFNIRINSAFAEVITACGETKPGRNETWINTPIRDAFMELHRMGHAHCVEAWKGDELVGGLYGLQLGAAFCGESMFSRATDASKVALVHLCARLKAAGFTLLDSQLKNPHLEQFGQIIISREEYMLRLDKALETRPDFVSKQYSEEKLIQKYFNF